MSIDKQNLQLFVDESMIQQVLVNLVLNSIDAVKNTSNRSITMRAYVDEKMSTNIEISDSGYGIEEENLENIFVPFFTTKKKGSGIGLNLCKQIVNAHNGTISVESEVNKGSIFTITF